MAGRRGERTYGSLSSSQLGGSGSDEADESEHDGENGEFHGESRSSLFLLESFEVVRSIRKWSLGVEVIW
jgi:hypothetical protein